MAVFGISTHLFHGERLSREHLSLIAEHGFEAIEVYATRTHFNYHDPQARTALAAWLQETGLVLHAVHAPTTTSYVNGLWGDTVSIGAADELRRRAAVADTMAALAMAADVPFDCLVLHLGFPAPRPAENSRDAVRRSLEELAAPAREAGVRLAIELIPNPLSDPSSLVRWLENDVDLPGAGICLDVGHAHLSGDVVDAIETCSGHIISVHLHDNSGRSDDHLVPGEGTIDWPGTLLAFQKVGYDGRWILELAPSADPARVLQRAARVRRDFAGRLDLGDEMFEG